MARTHSPAFRRNASRAFKSLTFSATSSIFAVAILAGCGNDGTTPTAVQIKTLSSAASMVSGNDTLIEVSMPKNTSSNKISVMLNDADVTSSLAVDERSGTLRGLISGLKMGENRITARSATGDAKGELTVTNYPISGPILSGPHMAPYECRTVESGLGAPLDVDCSSAQQISYFYRTKDNTFKPLTDPTSRPGDLASTTTTNGQIVPYIVRVDSGTINRAIYRIAVLDNPTADSVAKKAWAGNGVWNRKLIASFGGGCGNQYNQGFNITAQALDDLTLSRGYAFLISSELVNQLHCNPHLQGEALMMTKEYFIKHYGLPKWTAGTGSSGGAIQQYGIAQLYPGLLDGIQPGASFPDAQMEVPNCGLLKNYFATAGAAWTPAKRNAVEGYSPGACTAWTDLYNFAGTVNATTGVTAAALAPYGANVPCGLVDQSKKYNRSTNPTGARCDIYTANVNALGKNPATGFARRTFDNVGIQYGLSAYQKGLITKNEFLDVNEKIGGFDDDGEFVNKRTEGDAEGIRRAYATGLLNSFKGGIPSIPIITIRSNGSGVGDIHDRLEDFVVRARLVQSNGRSDNQIILTADPTALAAAKVNIAALSLDIMSRWLDAMALDSASSGIEKVVRNKPTDAQDTCWKPDGTKLVEVAGVGANQCNVAYPVSSSPDLVAGATLDKSVLKCELKAISYGDYPDPFTDADKHRLETIFPNGVCDWTKRSKNWSELAGTYLKLPFTQ